MMKQFFTSALAFFLFASFLNSLSGQTIPGKLLLVGGGSEEYGEWSDAPYQWAVDHSENRRVAVVTYQTNPSQWIPDYFEHLGAVEAKNFSIPSSAIADQQSTYDSLVTYDVIFFKGGDQEEYYSMYKNTLTQQAVEDVFNAGGVIGGTSAGEMILSKVLFTAEHGTVYPEEAIEDPNNYYMTLADDFLDLIPGYVFDSHVVERARFARLIGFLGHWKLNDGMDIVGIGVDDKTAFCIDSDFTGYAFGTGAVNIYKAAPDNEFSQGGAKLLATHLEVNQLLHECQIDLNNWEIIGLDHFVQPVYEGENFGGYVLLSGSDWLGENAAFIQHFSDAVSRDSVIIITGSNTAQAQEFRDKLEENNTKAEILQAIPANGTSGYFEGKIERIPKILFTGNQYETLIDFIEETETGNYLHDLILSGEKTLAFAGGDSRFAGGIVLINYDQEYASYDGLLEFGPGLGVLKSMIIMPNTFENGDIRENAAAGVPYGMIRDSLKYGIWLHGNSFAEYKLSNNMETTITSYGDYPMIFIETEGTQGGLSTQSAVNSGEPRDVAGFELFHMALMDESMEKVLGVANSISQMPDEPPVRISPNPADKVLNISTLENGEFHIMIMNLNGTSLMEFRFSDRRQIDVSTMPAGVYLLKVVSSENKVFFTQRIIII